VVGPASSSVGAAYYSPVGKLGDNFVDNSAETRFKVA
jgi:hypothetical protein